MNSDTNLLKLIAMLTMLCDHMGKMLFPQYFVMRIIGRIAFPIYAYCLAAGCVYTHNPLNYLKRMVLLALISQPIYAVAMGHEVNAMYAVSFAKSPIQAICNFYIQSWAKPSILAALVMGMLLTWTLRERQIVLTIALAVLCWLLQGHLDYGVRGIALMLLFYVFCTKRWLSLVCVLAYMLWWGMSGSGYSLFGISFGTQTFAIFALPLIYAHTNSHIQMPKWVFYAYYPAHLILIWLLNLFVF